MRITRLQCPVCDWQYLVPPLDAGLGAGTLAGVFGPGIMLNVAINQRNEASECALKAHLETHTLVEWVSKVTKLQAELDELRAAFT